MKVLLTGAFGNIGHFVLQELIKRGDDVHCLDIKTKTTVKKAKKLSKNISVFWGNIWSDSLLSEAIEGVDAVIHLAFLIPPKSEENQELSHLVNVVGTRCVIKAISNQTKPPLLVFTSSISVYGRTQHLSPPRLVTDPVNPIERYAEQKVLLENEIKEANIPYIILRLGAAPPIKYDWVDPLLFEVPLDDRLEYIAPEDAGLAIANSIHCQEAVGKILLIGGGAKNQLTMRKFLESSLEAIGLGMLPKSAFGHIPYHCDWMDTEESQRLLQFQRISFDDYILNIREKQTYKRFFVRLLRPLIQLWLLKKSPYYLDRKTECCIGKTAIVTGASSGIGREISKLLAKKGFLVYLTARSQEKLQSIADTIIREGGMAKVIDADLTREEDRIKIIQESMVSSGQIDVLVNNAGFGWYGYAQKMPWDVAKQMLQVNLESVVHLTTLALETMLRKGKGHILSIGSVAGDMPNQGIALYGATKAFLSSYSSAIFRELKGKNINISIIKPGPVATNFFKVANQLANSKIIPAEKYSIEPTHVASAVWDLIKKPKKVRYVPGFLSLTPSIEYFFGWIIDRLGPLLLNQN